MGSKIERFLEFDNFRVPFVDELPISAPVGEMFAMGAQVYVRGDNEWHELWPYLEQRTISTEYGAPATPEKTLTVVRRPEVPLGEACISDQEPPFPVVLPNK